jgi:carbamoyl-phosphate synthase large subunit
MPRRDDLRHVLVIGSGPIVIGQACEFDYSGTQACRVLREEGLRVSLVNSNPATIMTDPEYADATYVEPITPEFVEKVIARERPDALLATLGGQTALNTAVALHESGVLARYGVELIGADVEAIGRGEDRRRFKEVVASVGAQTPRSAVCRSQAEIRAQAEVLGLPVVIRPSYTMGGLGSGVARTAAELERLGTAGLAESPVGEVLVEESVLGWKEYELELMRDRNDNVVVVCSIENVDPMGVHTGDSVTVAPAMTLTDREYQQMRDVGIAVLRAVGVDTGGCNIQFAVEPTTGRLVVIEMNPRVSRSSALASKATGFPIAKIAAKLAIGYTLDEIRNDITRRTPASFEPTLDYVVVKIPRFAFEKFPDADGELTTTMKSVGEAMAIGRNFAEALGKALRSLETTEAGFWTTPDPEGLDRGSALGALEIAHAGRLYTVERALRLGASVAEVAAASGIDPWFVDQIAALVELRAELIVAPALDEARLRRAKHHGLSDRQIAALRIDQEDEDAVRALRHRLGVRPVYKTVDTCAAEFEATTPYHYSGYELDPAAESEVGPQLERPKVLILGSGPNRIGQGIEFDYSCVHAAFSLRAAGYETVMINCNPETVSTDYDTSDRLYFEPLTFEDVLEVCVAESGSGTVAGIIVQLGGQTPLGLAGRLSAAGLPVAGTSPEAIRLAEDRGAFAEVLAGIGLSAPEHGVAGSFGQARRIAAAIGYPVVLRPSFVLGGRGMVVVHEEEALASYLSRNAEVSIDHPVLIDRFLDQALEIDVDAVHDGTELFLGAVMEHVEEAGIHSGDSACVLPPPTLGRADLDAVRSATEAIARAVGVRGPLNVQFAIKDGRLFVIEANPRASRTVPFAAKATGVPLAQAGARVMLGASIAQLRAEGLLPPDGDGPDRLSAPAIDPATGVDAAGPGHRGPVFVKEAVLPFHRFRTRAGAGIDAVLGPEMKSIGEVMGIGGDVATAFAKAQLAAGGLPRPPGRVLVSVAVRHLPRVLPALRTLQELGFELIGEDRTVRLLRGDGIGADPLTDDDTADITARLRREPPALVISLSADGVTRPLDQVLRSEAARFEIPYVTTVPALNALAGAIQAATGADLPVRSLQEVQADGGWLPRRRTIGEPPPSSEQNGPNGPLAAAEGPASPSDLLAPPDSRVLVSDRVYDLINDHVFLSVDGLGPDRLHLKLEGFNVGGSIKIKTARALIQAAVNSGVDMRTTRFIESTSGNLGVALAVICAAENYRLTCVADPNSNATAVAIMRALGAEVVIIRERDENQGYLGSRINYIQGRLAREPQLYWLNQYANPSNWAAHEQHTAPAVLKAFPRVDHLFLGVGTGGTLMGCVNHFRLHSPHTRIVAVDAVGSVSFGSAPGSRHIPGLGTSTRPEILDPEAPDETVFIPEWEAVRECRWLARKKGLLAGGSTGTVLAAVRRLAPTIGAGQTVVAISPDIGERYLSTIYDDEWVAARGLGQAPDSPSVVLEPGLGQHDVYL